MPYYKVLTYLPLAAMALCSSPACANESLPPSIDESLPPSTDDVPTSPSTNEPLPPNANDKPPSPSIKKPLPPYFFLKEGKIFPYNPDGTTAEEMFSTTLPEDKWVRFLPIKISDVDPIKDPQESKENEPSTPKEEEPQEREPSTLEDGPDKELESERKDPPKEKLRDKRPIQLGSNNILIFAPEKNEEIDSDIQDEAPGSGLVITGKNVTTLKGKNTHRGWTNINEGTLAVQDSENLGTPGSPFAINDGTLAFTGQPSTLEFNHPIKIGDDKSATFFVPHSSAINLNGEIVGESSNGMIKKGDGTLVLKGPNSYKGTTIIEGGTLLVTPKTLPTNVENNAALTFHNTSNHEFDRQISGSGTTNIVGPGKLNLTGDNKSFTGKTIVKEGNLALNHVLGGDVFITTLSTFSGNGKILGNLFVDESSLIAPGNSIGTTFVLGNYTQNPGSTYLVYYNSLGGSSLIDVSGQASLGGQVIAASVDGIYKLDKTYTILKADGGILNRFDSVINLPTGAGAALYNPILSYDANHVFMNLEAAIINAAKTYNQRQVARQLDGITDPTDSQLKILNKMINLSHQQARHALNQMSGQQHAADLLVVEVVNRQFIRRLFDPLRDIVGSDPCIREWYEMDCSLCSKIRPWFEGSGSYLTQKGGSNTTGFKYDGGEITFGSQKTFCCCDLTAGIAGSYEYDYIRYHLGGKGSLNTFLGGVYALYRPARFYILSDLTFSYSSNRMKRSIEIGNLRYQAKSTPKICQVTSYGEFGIDYRWEDLLIQPFLGIEAGHYVREKVKEHGAEDLDLTVKSRKRTSVNSRLGVRLNAPNLPSDFNLYIDLSWIYRWTRQSNFIEENFDSFGTDMVIQGLPLYRNSFEGNLGITKEICDCVNFFAEYSGQFWKRSYSYYVLGGFEYKW